MDINFSQSCIWQVEVGIWGTQDEGGAGLSQVMDSDCECDTRVIGILADAEAEPCVLEEEGVPWSSEDTAVTLPSAIRGKRSRIARSSVCRAEFPKGRASWAEVSGTWSD